MKRLLAICLLWTILSSCSQVVCRHEALTAAIVEAENGYQVRIVSGTTRFGKHAQAQRFKDGQWQWLYVNLFGVVRVCDQDNFIPVDYWSANDYYISRFWHLMERSK